mgnify:CR=1 FL=1
MKLTKIFESKKPEPNKQNPVAKAMVQDPQFKSKVVADKKKQSKAGYVKHKGKIEEVSSMGMNKYGLAAKNVGGKFYSYKDGKETGVFDSMEELRKHQEQLLQQMDKKESINEDEKQEVLAIMAKHPEATAKLKLTGDLMDVYDTDLYYDLFIHFQDEMPYGTQKARDGDPVEYIHNELDNLGLLESKQKPYVSMYREVDPLTQKNKMVYDVLDNQGKSVHKTHDEAEAMKWFKDNYDRLKMEASGYEGQAEPTHHIFKNADIQKIADIIKQKDLKAYPEKTDDGVKVHTYNTDRKSVAQELELTDSVDPLRSDQGAKEELAKEIYNNSEEYQTEYEDWEAFMNSDDFEEENMRLKSKFEQQPEPELTADDHDDDDVPAFLKKYHDKEKELNYMRKLAGMSTASTNEDYARMTQDLIVKLVKQGKSNDEIQQATGEAGVRIDAIRKSVEQEQPKEATNDLAKSLNPLKGAVGSKQSTQMTAKGFDTIAKGERPTPQQTKAMEPFMSKIAKAITDPSTQAQMRNVIKKV